MVPIVRHGPEMVGSIGIWTRTFVMMAMCPCNVQLVQACTSDQVYLDILPTATDFASTKSVNSATMYRH